MCDHRRLNLHSGGFYIRCLDCDENWVAIKRCGQGDQDIDHTRTVDNHNTVLHERSIHQEDDHR